MVEPLTLDLIRNESDLPILLWDHYRELSQEKRATDSAFGEVAGREFVRTLPRGLWYVVRFFRFDGDILNGGIQQFFHNHTPREVCETLEMLWAIGAAESAQLLERAMAHYEGKYGWPAGSNERWPKVPLDDVTDVELNSLSDIRCNDESSRRDYALLEDYLRDHPEQCLPPGV